MPHPSVFDELRRIPFFDAMADADVAFLADRGSEVSYTPGELIFQDGAPRQLFAIILDGEVHSSPVIQSALRGSGQINGGSKGFDLKEAQDLAV